MKHLLKAALIAAGIFAFAQSHAQTHKDSKVGHKIDKTAKTVGHATAHAATTTESAIVDKRYDGKYGPQGRAVYINKYSHYYYVDSRGHKVYLKKSQLRDKPKR
jgi:hypothetical protein